MDVGDALTFLLGTWQLERVIEDHRSGEDGSFVGTATLERWPADEVEPVCRARYQEVGTLRLGAYSGAATRRLGCQRLADGCVRLRFEDGRPFVDLDLRHGRWHGIHRCGDDRYELTTVVRSLELVAASWQVRGPHKRYDARTTLVRAG